jgi:ATPase subunit of ABC transporter with duplicated ATPase domains
MQEQQRASKSKSKGEKSIKQRKWPTITSNAKARRAEETSGRKKSAIDYRKQELNDKLADLRLPEIINPKFSLTASDISSGTIVSISNGAIGYQDKIILQNINLTLSAQERLAIQGNNGSGKSTLVKAILNNQDITKSGTWFTPKTQDIGYIDQHYSTLLPSHSVLETISALVPNWNHAEIRRHLNDFLFRKNEEVNTLVKNLSGGEKARLSLAQIAAKTPKLLILDEITNNIDLTTKNHIIQILKNYPGTMIAISHEPDFLDAVGISNFYDI